MHSSTSWCYHFELDIQADPWVLDEPRGGSFAPEKGQNSPRNRNSGLSDAKERSKSGRQTGVIIAFGVGNYILKMIVFK